MVEDLIISTKCARGLEIPNKIVMIFRAVSENVPFKRKKMLHIVAIIASYYFKIVRIHRESTRNIFFYFQLCNH